MEHVTTERASCSVRALSHAAEIPYHEAFTKFEAAGRIKSQGTPLRVSTQVLKSFARKQSLKRQVTLARFIREHSTGRYIVRISGHMLAVIDGVPSDRTPKGSRIRGYWKIKG